MAVIVKEPERDLVIKLTQDATIFLQTWYLMKLPMD
jgi:hypothetical protein